MSPVIFTEAAAEKVKYILAEDPGAPQALRVFVKGGGCSGFQYGFTLEETICEDDFEFVVNDVKLVIDSMSMAYLQGTTIDYEEGLMSSSFTIKNPNATAKCGCGSSFAV